MDKLYKITNEAKAKDGTELSIYLDWSTSIMDDKTLEEWNSHKNNVDLSNMSPEQKIQYKKTPDAIKMSRWATTRALGFDPILDAIRTNPNAVIPPNYQPSYKFKLLPGTTYGYNERQAEGMRYLSKREIKEKLKPGQIKPDVHIEGYLIIEEMTPEDHMKWEKQKSGIVEEPKKEEAFKCETCGKECKSKAALLGHKKSHK